MPESITLEELWTKCRGLENAFRYYSDVIAATGRELQKADLMGQRIEVPKELQAALDTAFPDDDPPPQGPPRPCPPWCYTSSLKVIQGLGEVNKLAGAVIAVIKQLMVRRLQAQGADRPFEAYVSERPGTSWPDDMEGSDH